MSPVRRDHTAASLRAIGLPRALRVEVDAETRPLAVTRAPSRGRGGVRSRVERIEDIWRIAEAWWRAGAQARTYYRVVLEGGRPLTLFRDDVTGAWAEQPYSEPQHEAPR